MPEIPDRLALLQELINTYDVESRAERLDAAWLAERGLASDVDEAGLERLRRVREGLRAVALTHAGHDADPARIAALDEEARRAPLAVRFTPAAALEPAGDGVGATIGRLLAIVAQAEAEGTWERFKACAADTCQWAFYDLSRNRSRTWCSMEVCGNRAKARSYRERRG